jgi:hypothetical protein
MERSKEVHVLATALLAVGLAFTALNVQAQAQSGADATDTARLHIDNDLFAGRERDRDYTGGFAITLTGESAARGLLTLDPALHRIDREIEPLASAATVHYARQAGLMVFTPGDILSTEPVADDRPYASLLYTSNARMYVGDNGRDAWSSSITVGVLGLQLASDLHDLVHEAVGSESPQGYGNQISEGGEPTARYTLARHHLWVADPSGAIDVKTTVQGSVGFLTEASAAVSMRVGRFNSAWWSFAPELTDYVAAPVPTDSRAGGGSDELYVFVGARVKARAYNAFLQGQFRDSAVEFSYGDIEPIVAQAWIGVVTQIFEQTQLSYTLTYQTAELRDGEGAQSSLWGGVQLAHAF